MLSEDLTWKEWVQLGEAMKKANKLLIKKLVEIKPKSGDRARRLRKAVKSIGVVRHTLDILVIEAFPDKTRVGHIFYGPEHPNR